MGGAMDEELYAFFDSLNGYHGDMTDELVRMLALSEDGFDEDVTAILKEGDDAGVSGGCRYKMDSWVNAVFGDAGDEICYI